MRIIKYIVEKCEEELEDAENYLDNALLYKEENPSLADTLYAIAEQEIGHYKMLHEQAIKIISAYRQKNGEPPEAMKAIWDWEHKKAIDDYAIIQTKMKSYKGG